MSAATTRIAKSAANELRAAVSVVLPSDERYGDIRSVWNGAVRHRPAMIALCERPEDVQAAVRVARRHALPLSVRGGGHDWSGRAVRQDGLVIDLTGMREIEIDPQAGIATVRGGAIVRDLTAAAAVHNLVPVVGNCGAVGVAGLTLGGGYGPLNGAHGLAADNLIGAEVVLADGSRVATGPDWKPDLFWALRGGGGNFGVVTAMRVWLHPVRAMLSGAIVYPWEKAEAVLRRYAKFAAVMPEELGVLVSMASGPDGKLALQLVPLWNGDAQRGERAMRDLQALGTPRTAHVGPSTYPEMLASLDAWVDAAEGSHWEVRTRWLPDLSPGAIAAMIAAVSRKTSPQAAVIIHHMHGAATRIGSDATAFGLRSPHFMVEIIAGWQSDGKEGSAHRQWARDLWHELAWFALPGGYANLLAPDDPEGARNAYGGNAARLRDLKRRYDPDGVFASAIPLPPE